MNSRSNLDFHLDTAGELELHQRVDGFGRGTVDIQQPLVGTKLKLLTGFLVHEGRTQNGEDLLVRRKGDRPADDSARGLHGFYDLLSRFIDQVVIVRLQFDSDSLAHSSLV